MSTQFYIITGLSGAGKSQALKILEDMGFFCVDNLPVELLSRFTDLCVERHSRLRRVALGIDIRAGKPSLSSLNKILGEIRKKGIQYRIIFFTANDSTLVQRYSETRRKHPLGRRIIDGIKRERALMETVLSLADQVIDTSNLTLAELKEILAKALGISFTKKIITSVLSFGYKYGMPLDADLVVDVRFLPNPNYLPSLREKTGQDIAVKKYVQRQKPTKEFFERFLDLLEFLIPKYIREGKSYLTVAIGCTGGRHRSVVVAEHVAQFLRKAKYQVKIYHRDIQRGA